MSILITGACGFVGSTLANALLDAQPGLALAGLDNFSRPGSETNRSELRRRGVKLHHGDIRLASDFESLPPAEWVIDAAANPSVLAGVDARTSSRQLVEHNLQGTLNILEYCKRHGAGFILLSTSRVYSIRLLAEAPVEPAGDAFCLASGRLLAPGLGPEGVAESFSTEPPISLYGATKLASEVMALEYGETFGFPVWINRCGVLAGAGQFGRADQGIFAFWINAWLRRLPLAYIGFGGHGHQVRDCLHPRDLVPLLLRQMTAPQTPVRLVNLGGGSANAMSLAQLSGWCAGRLGARTVAADPRPRRFDIPWMVMDSSLARGLWDWRPTTPLPDILEEIATHAERNPRWLELSGTA